MICPKCKAYVNDYTRYCARCGTDVLGAPAYDASKGKRGVKHMGLPHKHNVSPAAAGAARARPKAGEAYKQQRRAEYAKKLQQVGAEQKQVWRTELPRRLKFRLLVFFISVAAVVATAIFSQVQDNADAVSDKAYTVNGSAPGASDPSSPSGPSGLANLSDPSAPESVFSGEYYAIHYRPDLWYPDYSDERPSFASIPAGTSLEEFEQRYYGDQYDLSTELGRSQALFDLVPGYEQSANGMGYYADKDKTIAAAGYEPASHGQFTSLDEIVPGYSAGGQAAYLASFEFFYDTEGGPDDPLVLRAFFLATEDGYVYAWLSRSDSSAPGDYEKSEQFFGGFDFK
ncbi:MAG: hypothetical protein LBR44_03270 [Clostridiales Family XIII bacterium]|jgi:hypothetical protein|nr:hypothetical protein [Clostridiales Family XIII bacterium]